MNRMKQAWMTVAQATIISLFFPSVCPAEAALDVGNRKQLLIDERFKPSLGLHEFQGSRANNIVEGGGSVFLDPKAPPEQRFKALIHNDARIPTDHERGGIFVQYSADGLTWRRHPVRSFPFFCDSDNHAFYDPRIGKYVAYFRTWDPWRKVGRIETDDLTKAWSMNPIEKPNYLWGPERLPLPLPLPGLQLVATSLSFNLLSIDSNFRQSLLRPAVNHYLRQGSQEKTGHGQGHGHGQRQGWREEAKQVHP